MPTNAEYERAHKSGEHRTLSIHECAACHRRAQRDRRAAAAAARRPVAVVARIHEAAIASTPYGGVLVD